MTPLWTVDGGNLVYNFHAGQLVAWDSDRRFVFVLAGTQSGKTSFGPLWLHREIMRRGPGDYLVVAPTFPLMDKKLKPELLRFFETTLRLGTYRAGPKVFTISPEGEVLLFGSKQHEPTRVILGSADRPGSLESATAKAAWLDEVGQNEFKLDAWEAVVRRLSLYRGRILGTTTLYNFGWMKQEVYDRWAAGNPEYCVVQFPSIANPMFPREEYERAKDSLPGWRFNLFYEGVYDRPAGMIYDCFVDGFRGEGKGGHKVREDFVIRADWPRYVGIDFGGANTAKIYIAQDPGTGIFYVYDEELGGGKTAVEHKQDIDNVLQGAALMACYGGAKSEGQWRDEFAQAGLYVGEPEVSDVEVGIQRVYKLLKTWRLFVRENCKGLLDELGRYSRKLDEHQMPTEDIEDKNTFHRLDAVRYISQALEAGDPVYAVPDLVSEASRIQHPHAGSVFGRREPQRIFDQVDRNPYPTMSRLNADAARDYEQGTTYVHVACGYRAPSSQKLLDQVRSGHSPLNLYCPCCMQHFAVEEFRWE